jgi:hypothetical protein
MAKRAGAKRISNAGTRKTSPERKTKTAGRKTVAQRIVKYPIAETLSWVAQGEKLLVKWGAIKSPGAKRVAGTVGQILMVLEALTALRKS